MTDNAHAQFAAAYADLANLDLQADSDNPHFKNKYASINAYFNMIKPVLLKHKLVMVTTSRVTPSGVCVVAVEVRSFEGTVVAVSEFVVDFDQPLATLGGSLTYNIRYAMRGMFSLPTEVDLDAPAVPESAPKSALPKSILSTKLK